MIGLQSSIYRPDLHCQLAGQLKFVGSRAGLTLDLGIAVAVAVVAGRQRRLLLLAHDLQRLLNDALVRLCHLWAAK